MALRGWWKDDRFRSLVLVGLAAVMEQADEALLPSVYREIGLALHSSPSALGSLTLVRSLTQTVFVPLAGFLAQQYNRVNIIAAGALMWAVATFFVGLSSTFSQVAISRGLNGIGLAVVGPAIKSLVADGTVDSNRGAAFGWLGVAGNLGRLGSLFAVLLADKTVLGVEGWRMAFHLVAALSVIIGALVYLYAVDSRFSTSSTALTSRKERTLMENLKAIYIDTKNVIKVRSFQIFVGEGVVVLFAWASLAFAPMWLELIGFSNEVTALVMGSFVVATSLGGLFGGFMGDYLSIRLPDTGRIILSQISAGLGIPLGAILLLVLPYDPSTPVLHGATFFIMGLCMSWRGSATNEPILAEIVPETSRANIYALDQAFKAGLPAFGPPMVGLLAEHVYGYAPPPKGADSLAIDKENAAALADAIYTSFGIPFFLCTVIYSGLYWTYPRDRDRVRKLQMNFENDSLVPLDEIASQEEYIWPVPEEEDKDEDRKADEQSHFAASKADDGINESETARMLPKHQ